MFNTPMDNTPKHADKPYLVVIGDSTMDIAGIQLSDEAMWPKAAGAGVVRFKRGGVARNVAENLARLGCDCSLISAFGHDRHGRMLMAATRQAGVDLSPSIVVPDAPTAVCLILNSHDGEMFYMLGDLAICQYLTPERLAIQCERLDKPALIVSNVNLSTEALAWLFAQHGDVPIFIDTVVPDYAERVRPWLAQVQMLKPNRREASLLSGLPFNAREDAPAVANWFHHAGVRQVVLSLGAHGLYYSDGKQADWLAPLPVEVVNVTGAGDALMAGLAYGTLQGMPFADSVAFGNACAALTLTTLDNNHPQLAPSRIHALLQSGPAR